MLTQISIKNFRILKDLKLTDLGRINLIAGLNGSGKTSFLEAAFLLTASGNPQFFLNPNVIRGPGPNAAIALANSEGPWKEIFSNLDRSKTIEIAGQHKKHGELKLKIEVGRSPVMEIRAGRKDLPFHSEQSGSVPFIRKLATNAPDAPTLELAYVEGKKSERKGQIQLNAFEADIVQPTDDPSIRSIYLTSRSDSGPEDAVRLGKLRLKKHSGLLLDALQIIEPRVRSVEDSSATGFPTIFADVGLDELVPLPILGDGMIRVVQLLLSIASVPTGVVFVDEVENGLHHSKLSEIWRVVDKAAAIFNVQVVSTTHSLETVIAAHESLDGDSFRFFRLEANGKRNKCVNYSFDDIGIAIKHRLEIR